ncbi:stalk domain-containing protein [Cohnella panacarvi]|uniref:stalk domain-containing protein n=1 Tax=Cohnella panacarvi TaxID=400776 RepID=UPI00047A6A8B|nr:stalk domain-containing protein [Cohnella panacarvi]
MHKLVKSLLVIVMMASGLLIAQPRTEAASYSSYAYPQGNVGLKKPQILFEFMSSDITPELKSYTMTIDDVKVDAQWNIGRMILSYTPSEDLQPGEHTVDIVLELKDDRYLPLERSWTFRIDERAVSDLPAAPTAQQSEGIEAINDYRVMHGLNPLAFNKSLTYAAQVHARYLETNKVAETGASMHEEDSGLPDYIGSDLNKRGEYAGYTGAFSEDVSYNGNPDTTITHAIDGLFDAPYHRMPFLMPEAVEIGLDKQGNYTVIEFGLKNEGDSRLVVSPAPGDPYVPVDFDGNETPDPIRNHSDAEYPVGYPIMVQLAGKFVRDVQLVESKLTDRAGNELDLLQNTPKDDDHLRNEVMLIPIKPLSPDTVYTAYVKLSVIEDNEPRVYEKKWDFRTEPIEDLGKSKLHSDSAAYAKLMNQPDKLVRVVSFGLADTEFVLDDVIVPMKQKPIVKDGSSYLWIRDLAGALGASVDWDDQRMAAIYSKQGRTITLYTNQKAYALNGQEVATNSPAILDNGSTLIPVRLLSEVLGAKVDFDDTTRTVTISY